MTDRSESHAAQRLAEETGEPRERFTADDKPLPELDELEPVTDAGVDQDDGVIDRLVCLDLFAGLGGFSAAFEESERWDVEVRRDE